MDSIRKIIAELINDFSNLVVIFVGGGFSDKTFESGKVRIAVQNKCSPYSRAPCFRLS